MRALGVTAGVAGAALLMFYVYGFTQWTQVNQVTQSTWEGLQRGLSDRNAAAIQQLWSKRVTSKNGIEFFRKWVDHSDEAEKLRAAAELRFDHWQRTDDRILAKGKLPDGGELWLLILAEDDGWKLDRFEFKRE